MAIVLITHDLGVVAGLCERVMVMYGGRIVEEGPIEPIFDDPQHPYTRGLLGSMPRLDEQATAELSHHPRAAAQPPGPAGRLRVPRPLPVRVRALPGAARAARVRPRPSQGLPPGAASRERGALEGRGSRGPFPDGGRRRCCGAAMLPLKAVDGVSFELRPGETLGIVGESGCGKSTLGRAVLRLIEPSAGRVVWLGDDLGALDAEALRRHRRAMQIVFQDPLASLNPRMTVGDIIAEPLITHEPRLGKDEVRARVADMLAKTGLLAADDQPLPARVLGRPVPADRHRPGDDPGPQADRLRRAGLGARRLDPGADRQSADAAAARVRPVAPVHQPRSRGGPAHQPPHPGALSRPDDGAGRSRRALCARRGIPIPRR